ncbi:hypothetical protein BDM02DRAFT_3131532 [Thelephora ganbajun]|uniref:Uncharacterized protein n=1 Tax=Thelephora ganbajun TaxID=370292 RepID=A0ACB6Z5I1_THEGA|nr:hypothetical protein BDM02DRAFT_3131532 [Thelephora ganbajun]
MPLRKPLATLDPQSAHSWLTEDMSNSPSSSRLPTDPKDAVANCYGRQIMSRGSIGDEGIPVRSASSSRKNSLAQNLSGVSLNRSDSRRASLASSVSTRRGSVPTIHLKGSPTTAISPSLPIPPQPTHPTYINNDELYSGLKTYSFGAPGIIRSSSPESDILESYPSPRYFEHHQRPRRSLSSVPTLRDEMEIDEAEISRHSRAKMRAIDDGGRRPSLPKNPASSPSPPPSASSLSSSDVIHRNENPSSSDIIMDDRASTYTFGVPAMYHHSDSEQSSYLDEEPLDHLSTSPITFAHTPPGVGDDEEGRRNSFVVPIGHDIQLRRGSVPLAIPETPRPNNRAGMISGDEIQAMRKMSRSLDDEISILGLGDPSDIHQPGGSARSEPLSKADWSSFQQHIDARTTPRTHAHRSQPQAEGEDESSAYTGLNLAYILGSDEGGRPRSSWSSESFVQRRQSVAQNTGGFVGFGLSFGRDVDRRPSVATATGEDTFLRHLQHNDANYALRLEEWTFGKEKADATGPRLSGLTAGGITAPTIGPGTYELWKCHVVGRFNVERLALQYPYSVNRRGGPGVIVHKHSQAKAFSIFRSHDLFKPKQTQKPGQGTRHLDTSQSILLATKNVQEQYTSTKTTERLKTHGLLEERSTSTSSQPPPSEGSTDGGSQQGGSPAPIRRSRSHSLVRKDKGAHDKGKVRSLQKEEKKKKEKEEKGKKKEKKKDGTGSQTSSREGVAIINKGDGFWSRLPGRHSATHSSLPSLSNNPIASGSGAATTIHTSTPSALHSTVSTPTSTANSSPIVSENSIPTSEPSFRSPPHPRIPSSSRYYRSSRSEIGDGEDEDDDDDFDGYRAPVQKRSHAEIYASLTPIHHEQARNLIRSSQSSIAGSSRPRFPKMFPRKGYHPSDWLQNSPTTSLAPSPVPWMLTNNSNSQEGQIVMSNLNDNFGAVGLVPPRPIPQRPVNKTKNKSSEGLILPVPDDSVYMLLPLFVGETDSEFQPEDMAQYEVPLESRKYLLVYYVPFDKRMEGVGGKKVEQLTVSNSASQRTKSKTVFLNSFRVSAHLMSYQDFKGSGIRLPATGLSVTGPLTYAHPPNVEPELHRDPIAIAQCSKRDRGIEFLPEGLHKLGLCDAEQVDQMVDPDDFDDDDEKVEYKFELNALGRAVVEMAWVGAMAVTSFGTT